MPLIRRLCLLVVMLLPGSGFASGIQTLEQGTWDLGRGMVGAVTAADSAATAFYNPAGMTRFDRPEITGGLMGIIGETRFDPDGATTVPFTSRGGNQSGNIVAPGGLFYVHPLNEEWSLGFSMTAPFVGVLDPSDDWPGRYQLTKLDLASYRFSPTAAYRVNDWLSLGATVGVNYTDLGLRVAVPTPGPLPDGNVRVKDADQWRVSFSLGAMIEPVEGTRIGLSYFSEVDNDDLGGDFTLSGALGIVESSIDVKFTLPQIGVVGVRQELGDDLVVFADVAWADYSAFSSLGIDIDAGGAEIKTHFRDAVAYGVAAEYQLAPDWVLSAGVLYASSPVRGQNRLAMLPVDRQYRYGAGVRHMLREDLTVGLSYEYLDLGTNRLTNSTALGGTVSGDYHKNKVQFIALTLSKAF